VGRLHPKKGLDALVMAWARRERQDAASMASWRLVLAGWDQDGYEAKLRVLAAELDVGDKIHFVGPVFDAEKRMSFAAADAVILPSLSEGLPMTVLEAWSHGKPVLMTEACNLPRGLQAGAALRLCPGPEGIAEGIEEFVRMTDPERMVMGERGLMLVKNHLQWPQLAERMRSVYAWLMGMGDRPEWVAT
jgi:poly(glycerol-phosphate) alpha-glucosyltransferase